MDPTPEAAWHALWSRVGASGDPVPLYSELVTRYSEPQRTYHTLAHVEQCLREFDRERVNRI